MHARLTEKTWEREKRPSRSNQRMKQEDKNEKLKFKELYLDIILFQKVLIYSPLLPAKAGHGPHSSKIFVLSYVLFVLCRSVNCVCVNVYCTTATGWLPNCI